ncbi:hypothetical protein GCM10028819_51430 [Spirosoma humi]
MSSIETPLFDKLNETIDFIWCRTVPLFTPQKYKEECEKPLNEKDWFLVHFIASLPEAPGLAPPYERTRFYRMADRWEGLLESELIRRELTKAVASCPTLRQVDLLCAEIEKTRDKITEITSFIFNDMPNLTVGWIEAFQRAIDKFNDKSWEKSFLERTGRAEWNIAVYRDIYWPAVIKYLKRLPKLALGIHIYTLDLKGFNAYGVYNPQESSFKLPDQRTTSLSIILSDKFKDIFEQECDAYSCLAFLKRLNLIKKDGTHQIGARQKNSLMAFVEALQQRQLLPPARPTSELTQIFAQQIGLPYSRPRNESIISYDDALRGFIRRLNAISIDRLTWTIMDDNGR